LISAYAISSYWNQWESYGIDGHKSAKEKQRLSYQNRQRLGENMIAKTGCAGVHSAYQGNSRIILK